jgi:hypothetical protein
MAVLFLPIWFNLAKLYPWAHPDPADEKMQEIIRQKGAYLNVPFFGIRALVYFAVWATLAFILSKWSKEQDEEPALPTGPKDRRSRVLSGPGLVLYMITITFMSVDWIMSLDPHWYSTIFGILTLGWQGLSTMAFTVLMLAVLSRFKPMSEGDHADPVPRPRQADVRPSSCCGPTSPSRSLLIIWSGNLPRRIPFYLAAPQRALVTDQRRDLLLEFALPFLAAPLAALSSAIPNIVKWIALGILFMRLVDVTWTIGPGVQDTGSTLSWVGLRRRARHRRHLAGALLPESRGRSLLAARDPLLQGCDRQWRTLERFKSRRPSKPTASATAASSGSS